jgi:hypothetical protein
MIKIVDSLNKGIETLDISHNPKIGAEAYKYLCESVLENEKYTELKTLIMEGNMIGD